MFPWPKDRKGFRPMAWLDPLDHIAYRAMVGRLVGPIVASIDGDVVLSNRVKGQPPRWRLERYQAAIKERRKRAGQLLVAYGVLAQIDIRQYFPSVTRAALEAVIGRLPVHGPSFDQLLDWLDDLQATSEVTGLPIGSDGSQVLGNGLLVPGDEALAALGIPFLRYVDDTWCFLRHGDQFPGVLDAYMRALSPLGFRYHPDKTRPLDPLEALETIERSAIQYIEAADDDRSSDDLATGLDLFAYAIDDPDDRRPELRRALTTLKKHHAAAAFEAVVADVSLIALAPGQWRSYLRSLLSDRNAAKKTQAPDWVLDRVTKPVTQENAYVAVVLLQSAALLWPNKEEGGLILAAALDADGWAEPVQVACTHLWGRSHAFKPHKAVELTEAAPSFTTKRAFALSLANRRDNPKIATWADGVRRSHPDLDAGTGFAGFADDAGEASAVDQVASSTDARGPIGIGPTRISAAERTSGGIRLAVAAVAGVLALGAGALATILAGSSSQNAAAPTAAGHVPAWWAASVGRRAPPALSA